MFGIVMPWKRIRFLQGRFREERREVVVDDEMFARLSAPDANDVERRIMVIARRLVARDCGVEPQMLRPDDPTPDLSRMMGQPVWWAFILDDFIGLKPFDFTMWLGKAMQDEGLSLRFDTRIIERACEPWWDERRLREPGRKDFGAWAAAVARSVVANRPGKA